MAETPKAENDTGATVTGGEGADTLVSASSDTSSDTAATTKEDRAAGAGSDTLSGGSATEGSDSVSGAAASSAVDHGSGKDSLADTESQSGTGSGPWAAPTASRSSDDSLASSESLSGSSGNDSLSSGSSSSTTKPASQASGGGGFTRFVVFLILIVLIAGAGYATYPEWRDEAAPYAEMVGVTLPPVPDETDPDAPTTVASSSEPASASSDSSTSTTAPAPSVSTDTSTTPSTGASETAAPETEAVSAAAFDALSDRVSALEDEIKRLSDTPAPVGGDATADDDLADRIGTLEQRFTALADEMSIVRQGLGAADDTDGVAAVTSSLTDRLSEMDARLSELEQRQSTQPAVSPGDLAALGEQVENLRATSEGGDADLVARLDSLAADQKALSEKLAQGRNKQEQAGAFLLATNLLSAAASDSGGFAAELDAVETAALDQPEVDEALAALKANAGGVPSQADLRVRFPAVAASVIDASIVGADDGVVGTALTRIASLVTLRRTETEEGDNIDAIVNRAEAAVNAGDLPGAVQALSALDGDPAKVAEPWIAEATARIAVDRAVRTLQSRALATLSGG